MNLNPDLGAIQWKKLTARRRLWLALAAVALLVFGGWALWRHFTNPPRPWLVRWQLGRFLKKEALTGDFKINFPLPSKAEMSTVVRVDGAAPAEPKGTRTGRTLDVLRNDYMRLKQAVLAADRALDRDETDRKELPARIAALEKELADAQATNGIAAVSNLTARLAMSRVRAQAQAAPGTNDMAATLKARERELEPVEADLRELQAAARDKAEVATGTNSVLGARLALTRQNDEKLRNAESYAQIYRTIGQELWVAAQLLESRNDHHRREGINLCFDACRQAIDSAINGWVAARICEGYILPNLDVATDANRRSRFHPDNYLNEVAGVFRSNNEAPNVVRVYEEALDLAKTSQRKDWARSQIAATYERAGELRKALQYLRQIENTNDYRWTLRQIPRLETQLKRE